MISRASALLLCVAVEFANCAWAQVQPQAADGILERFALSAETSQQWKLPDKLNEISGLASTADARLLAVTDESAIVYELDYAEGRLIKAFALGEPTVSGDFEGIAYFDGQVWLVTSEGVIYESAEGEDGERVAFDRYPTGLGKFCEIEGLAYRQSDNVLLALCKKIKKKSNLASLTIFAWSTTSYKVIDEKTIALPDREIAAALRNDRLNPSGIAIDPVSGNLLVVASRPQAVIELDPGGGFMSARVLPLATRHRQAEGIEILATGDLLIADEGGAHKARLALYRPGD
ncbi:MAG: SdiA-regulated domain-containing protein [Woeseia sp.]